MNNRNEKNNKMNDRSQNRKRNAPIHHDEIIFVILQIASYVTDAQITQKLSMN